MFDRHLIGDFAVAILLAVPTVALSRPQAPVPDNSSPAAVLVHQAAQVDQTPAERRVSFDS